MGKIRRQSILGAFNLYVGQGLGMVNKLLLFPLAFAGSEEYWGLLVYLTGLSVLVGSVANFGFTKVIQRFVPVYQNNQAAITGYALRFTAAGGIVALALAWLFKDAMANFSSSPALLSEFFLLFMALLLAQLFFEAGSAMFNANFKTHYGIFANNVSIRAATSFILVAKFVFGFGPGVFIALVGGAYLLNHTILMVLALKAYPISAPATWPEMPKQRLGSYALFMLLLTLVSQSFLYLDALLVGHFLVLSQLAIFDLTKNLASVMDLPARALGSSALPSIAQLMEKSELEKVEEVYQKGSFMQLFAGLFLFAGISIHLDLLLDFVYHGRFNEVKPLFYIIFLGKLIDMATGLNWAIISNSSKYWANLIIGGVVLVATIGLEWVLIPRYGLPGAAAGIAIALLLNNALRSIHLYKSYGLNPFGKVHGRLVALITLTAFCVFFSTGGVWIDILIKDFLLLVLAVYYVGFSETIPELDDLFVRLRQKVGLPKVR